MAYINGKEILFSATVKGDIVHIPDGYIQPSGDLEITENGTKDVTNYVSVTVNVPTSGGTGGSCSGNHIIEVDTLPTENIDENALYKMGDSYYKYANDFEDLIMVENGVAGSYKEGMAQQGVTVVYYTVDNYENVVNPNSFVDTNTMTFSFYYDMSRQDVFIYNAENDDEWMSLSGTGASKGGVITDISQATTDGYYALLDNGWKKYLAPEGSVTIVANGTFDVKEKAEVVVNFETVLQEKTVTKNGEVTADEGYDGLSKVIVNVPTYITVTSVDDLPTDVTDGTIAIVEG